MPIVLPDEEGAPNATPGSPIVLPDEVPEVGEESGGIGRNLGAAAAVGTAAAAGTWGVGRLLKWAFPGMLQPTKKALWNIDRALKKDFGGAGLKDHFTDYSKLVRETGQPVTFADYLASRNSRAPHTMKLLNTMLDEGGKPALIADDLQKRGEGKRGRVLQMLAQELGVPDATFNESLEELVKKKNDAAGTLYGEAFKNKSPIRDTNLYSLFDKYGPAMEGALENAKEAFKFDPSKMVEAQTMASLAAPRKDAWRFPINAEDIPEYLHVGAPKGGLQTYISPNIETLDRMKRALWALEQKRIKEGAGDVGEIRKARRELTAMLDQIGPQEYKQARQQYAGDVALEEALETGKNVFKQNPDDLRKSMLTMSPEERQMLARGFYGALQDMNDPKFVREVISGSPAYRKQKDLLSAVFPDTKSLHNFLRQLEAEQAMMAGEKEFVRQGAPASAPSPLVDNLRAITSANSGDPRATLFGSVHLPPWDPTGGVPRKGSEVLFSSPTTSGTTSSHPAGRDIYRYLRGYPRRSPMDVAVPGAVGAATGYGAATMGEDWQRDLVRMIDEAKKRKPRGGLSAIAEDFYP